MIVGEAVPCGRREGAGGQSTMIGSWFPRLIRLEERVELHVALEELWPPH